MVSRQVTDLYSADKSVAAKTRVGLVCVETRGSADGIRDYTDCLGSALAVTERLVPFMVLRTAHGPWKVLHDGGCHFVPSLEYLPMNPGDCLALQYNPFMYGRRGFAPWLIVQLLRLRRSLPHVKIMLTIHETYVSAINWKWALMGAWQRLQLAALLMFADLVVVTTQRWADQLKALQPMRPIAFIPVGSNLPDMRGYRQRERSSLGLSNSTVLATFGQKHPSHLRHFVVEAANTLAKARLNVTLLDLGAHDQELRGLDSSVRMLRPGRLQLDEIARYLAAADIFLAPYSDGASTRRTTLMAALQHELAIVTTGGVSTDSALLSSAVSFVALGQPEAFAVRVLDVAIDANLRERLAKGGRRAYDEFFAWPIIAQQFVSMI
jgi:glycosyltransferase involved in cell wall biosynthesis